MVFVPVTEIEVSGEMVGFRPRAYNHFHSRRVAEELGFDMPSYPAEVDGYATCTRQLREAEGGWICELIRFQDGGYTLSEEFIQNAPVHREVGDMYRNGVGRWADHR
jgi:hypothetical protein